MNISQKLGVLCKDVCPPLKKFHKKPQEIFLWSLVVYHKRLQENCLVVH